MRRDEPSVLEMLGDRGYRAIGLMLYSLLAVLPVVLVAMMFGRNTTRAEHVVVAALLIGVVAMVLLHRQRRLELLVALLATGLVVVGAALGVAFGSIRSTGSLALVGGIVVSGLFLGRTALVAIVGAGACAAGALVAAENAGLLRTPNYAVGGLHWVIYVATLSAIALNIWAVREVVVDAARRAREGEARLGSVLRNTPAALITSSVADGRVLDVNVAYERIFGLRREGAIGRTVIELGLWDDANDRDRFVQAVRSEGRVAQMPLRLRRASGEVFDAHISAETLDLRGEPAIVSVVTDVSAESAARRALETSEARFRSLFSASPAALLVQDAATGALLLANAAAERTFRAGFERLSGQGPDGRIWSVDAERDAFWGRLRQDGRVASTPARLRRVDGEIFDAVVSAELAEQSGERHALVAVVDVSQETRARAAQHASEERFSKAFQSSPIGMTITRLSDGAYLEANAADERTLGYTRAELIGQTTLTLGAWPSEQERARFVSLLEQRGRVMDYETRMRNRWGQLVDVRLYAERIEIDGEPCVLASALNVTDQKLEEDLILEAARGVSVETGEAFFRRLVEHLARATGADRANVGELIDGGRRVRTVARYVDGVQGAQVEYELADTPCEVVLGRCELMVWTQDIGEAFPRDEPLVRTGVQSYMGAPLIGVDGKAAGVMNVLSMRPLQRSERLEAVFRIFAARAQAELARLQREREIIALNESLERRVRERTAELEAANRELEAFSYSVSHDLRSPLNGVDGLTQLLEARHGAALGDEARDYLRRTRDGVQRMRLIIEDLLALSSVNRSAVKPQPVDLSSLARSIADELQRTRPGRRVQWRIADGLTAHADPGLVHIALTNLLGNAWKYSSRREDACIEFGEAARAEGRTEFVVRDNGAGFDMAYAEQLFQPFRRLHGQGEFEGTGIGLAIVRRIVERHGGSVRGEGRVGEGASFHFSLPAARGAATPGA